MRREVECQVKERRVSMVRLSPVDGTDPFDEVEKVEYYIVFYDTSIDMHRNAYTMFLTEDEANAYEVDKVYTLTIK